VERDLQCKACMQIWRSVEPTTARTTPTLPVRDTIWAQFVTNLDRTIRVKSVMWPISSKVSSIVVLSSEYWSILGVVLQGGSSSFGFLIRTIVKKKTPRTGGFLSIKVSSKVGLSFFYSFFFRGGPFPPGSWSGNIVKRKPPWGGGLLAIKVSSKAVLSSEYGSILGAILQGGSSSSRVLVRET